METVSNKNSFRKKKFEFNLSVVATDDDGIKNADFQSSTVAVPTITTATIAPVIYLYGICIE